MKVLLAEIRAASEQSSPSTARAPVACAGLDLVHVDTGRELLAQARANAFDLILVGAQLRDGCSAQLLPHVQQAAAGATVVVLGAEASSHALLRAMRIAHANHADSAQPVANSPCNACAVAVQSHRDETASIAHDIRNRITGILGQTALLESRLPGTGKSRDLCNRIQESTERLVELVSAMQHGGAGPHAVEVEPLIHALEQQSRHALPANGQMVTSVEEGLGRVRGEWGVVMQALWDVVDEACRRLVQGGTIAIDARRTGAAGTTNLTKRGRRAAPGYVHISISVAPRGGCAGADLRLRTRAEGGAAAADSRPRSLDILVVSCGWSVRVEGDAHAPIIHFQAPCAEPRTKSVALPVNECRAAPFDERPRVLIVDDDPAVLEVMRDVLDAAGFCVDAVANCADARRRFADGVDRYVAVVTDLVLPDGSGADLIADFRAAHARMPVIVCSGQEIGEAKAQLSGVGPGVRLLPKPFPPALLVDAVSDAYTARSRRGDELTPTLTQLSVG